MVLGATAFGGDAGIWWTVLVVTGGGMIVFAVGKYGLDWFRYLCGVAAVAKFALLFIGLLFPAVMLPCLWGCLLIGGVISHAPGSLRHAPLFGAPGPCVQPQQKPI
jgi:hypothetical protein